MKAVNMKNCGTLPDLGNFCIEYGKDGCKTESDRYLGVEELMPFAKGVSAKTNVFDDKGNEAKIDYVRMMKIIKKSGFKGIIGVEYEGPVLSEYDGIRATKKLLERVATEV